MLREAQPCNARGLVVAGPWVVPHSEDSEAVQGQPEAYRDRIELQVTPNQPGRTTKKRSSLYQLDLDHDSVTD
jgi:hypothetical protein